MDQCPDPEANQKDSPNEIFFLEKESMINKIKFLWRENYKKACLS